MENYDKERQFHLSKKEYLKKMDFLNWFRFFAIIKKTVARDSNEIPEIGPGEGTIKNVLLPFVGKYETLDLNPKLNPDHVGDVRDFKENLRERYDCVIAADILEHIPFKDLEIALKNLNAYLKTGGIALITIPNHSHYFLFMTSVAKTHKSVVKRIPTLKRFFGKKVSIDPDHEWEINDGKHKPKDVERTMKNSGFLVEKKEKLPYVDFWILRK